MPINRRLIAIAAVPVVAAGAAAVWFGRPASPPPATPTPAPTTPPAPPPAASAPPAPPPPAEAPSGDPRFAERSIGRAGAPTVIEYFSLTCGHCAGFHRETMPQVKRDLVETGRVRIVFRDFPLDAVALAAAQVARSLPPERYDPFVSTLFQSQDRWAFARGANPQEELFKIAALAGMSRAQFDAALADQELARFILEQRVAGQQQHNVNSTPTFVFGSRTVPGNMAFDRFAALVAEIR